jgi:hypothetical protein
MLVADPTRVVQRDAVDVGATGGVGTQHGVVDPGVGCDRVRVVPESLRAKVSSVERGVVVSWAGRWPFCTWFSPGPIGSL